MSEDRFDRGLQSGHGRSRPAAGRAWPAPAGRPARPPRIRRDALTGLTPRDVEVLLRVAEGDTNAELAAALSISAHTIKNHLGNILRRLGARNRQEAVWRALGLGLITHPGYSHSAGAAARAAAAESPIEIVHEGDEAGCFAVGELALYECGRVLVGGREIRMCPLEAKLLRYFAGHVGRTFTRQQLLDGVWGTSAFLVERNVDAHIRKLRRDLPAGCEYEIRTVRGYGYCMAKR
jgi:DNA-binding response OmpR family regulator